ncbi:AMP deaminase [Arachnomyces sp. PD_36]|nr:AMP deaminase [Arachnomyces sp. PD_36]
MASSRASETDKPAQKAHEGLVELDETVSAESAEQLDNGADEGEDNGEEGRSSEDSAESILPRDRQRRTATYDYAYEKSMSHAEAKLFYQRHQLESKNTESDQQSQNFVTPTQSVTHSVYGGDAEAPSRTTNITSPRSNQGHVLAAGATQSAAAAVPPQATWQETSTSFTPSTNPPLKRRDSFEAADQSARSHAMHPGLPHEHKPYLLATEGIHGAGAGIGIGQGAGGFAANDNAITAELNVICRKIQSLLDKRHKYIRLSLQRPGDNPRDDPGWEIYPPPPEPVWDKGGDPMTASYTGNEDAPPTSQSRRKGDQGVGQDFNMEDCLPVPGESPMTFKLDENSVYQVYETDEACEMNEPIINIPSLRDFYMDLDTITEVSTDGPIKTFAFRRLSYLEGKFQLHALLNEYQEIADSKKVPHRDFYNVRKVDTHVHHSACMNQKHLLRFIKSKMKKSPDEVVLFRDGKHLTLKQVFESINLTAYDLSIDTLDMHAHTDSFHRFDKFNLKYNPVGESRLREIFLKTDNYIKGRYLAEITKEVMSDLESSKYQMVEWRISIYGRSIEEWDKLAAWVVDNKLFSPNVRWLIQVPRLYDIYKSSGMIDNFEQVVTNVFQPLFEVTKDPSKHPKLHIFLQRVVGFDSVDDESKAERRLYRKYPIPKNWNTKQNPPYSYWMYFMFANVASLNTWRKQRGFSTFVLRPHCGEAGDPDHLAAALLCCHGISHGILLRKVPLLQYLYYIEQIPMAMSPLSNNALFLTYDKNPCANFFKKGLNISLSTDDPLQFAFTKEPLIEEYSVAAQIYKFSAVDMCELAKHSVDQSGFELSLKQRWLGPTCNQPGVAGNNVAKSNVPDIREAFRHETLLGELALIDRYSSGTPNPILSRQTPTSASIVAGTISKQAMSPSISSKAGTNHQLDGNNANLPPSALTSNINSQPQNLSLGSTPGAPAPNLSDNPTGGLAEQRIFPGIMHERIRKETGGEERDAGVGAAGNGASGYDYSSGDGENGAVVGKKPEWNLDEMDDE